jgi:exodeoxyribonuclease V alpha subunit
MATESENAVLSGTLGRILFQNTESQWTVAKLAVDDRKVEVTIVGALLGVQTGTPLQLRGSWVVDRRYGEQFKIESYQTKTPETLNGIERYLGSGLVPGIGPELAKRIVSHFGMQTLEVISDTPQRLVEVAGIGSGRVGKISAAWKTQRDIQDVMVFLRGHGVSTAFAVRIYKRYGRDAIGLVRANPYRLALEVWGIGFKTADSIARNLGIDKSAPERVEAGLVHVLGELTEDGHVHVPQDHGVQAAADLLDVESNLIEAAIERLQLSGLIVREELGARGPCLSLVVLHQAETRAASAVRSLLDTPSKSLDINSDEALAKYEQEANIELAQQQRSAIVAALTEKLVVITGGPGVGKTTIVRGIVSMLSARLRRIALCAPTGRAAKRLGESTGAHALTIHRLLEFQPRTAEFARGPEAPLDADVVIVDEASMIDIALFDALVSAIPPRAQLVLVGDIDQLPSVGPGSVLSDVIASGAATVVTLTEIFRQAAASSIITSAHNINCGIAPELAPPPGDDPNRSDFYFIERDDATVARETIVGLVGDRIPNKFGHDAISAIQVLTPMHRGELGTAALNAALQSKLNPASDHKLELRRGERIFRVGDKVMQIRNDYDKEVFNGDVGVIESIDKEEGTLRLELLDDRLVEYEKNELDELIHAFAISVHKSQGSEYPVVVLPLMMQHFMMLQRNLLYTAITRGKKLVVLVGSRKAIDMAVKNNKTRQRWTWLAERIRDATQARAD